jgi:hypothetical protein
MLWPFFETEELSSELKETFEKTLKYETTVCSARTGTRIGLLEEIPRSGVQIPCLYLKGHYRCTRSLCYQAQTPV